MVFGHTYILELQWTIIFVTIARQTISIGILIFESRITFSHRYEIDACSNLNHLNRHLMDDLNGNYFCWSCLDICCKYRCFQREICIRKIQNVIFSLKNSRHSILSNQRNLIIFHYIFRPKMLLSLHFCVPLSRSNGSHPMNSNQSIFRTSKKWFAANLALDVPKIE